MINTYGYFRDIKILMYLATSYQVNYIIDY